MLFYFAAETTNNTIGIWQIIVPTALSVLLGLGSAWAVLSKYQQKVDGLIKDSDRHETKIDDLKDRVSKLEGGLDRDRAHGSPYTQAQSPVSLTDRGKALLLDSGGNKYLEDNSDALIGEIKAQKPKTAYDVQETAKKVIATHSNDDSFIPLKNYLFKEGINLEDLISVVGIALRDMALPVLGFKPEQIDESDPHKKSDK